MKTRFTSAALAALAYLGSIRPAEADGQLDSSFFHENFESAGQVMVRQPDGRLVSAAAGANFIERILPDGGVDPSFTNATYNNVVNCIGRHSDGKIVIGGGFFAVNGASRGRGLARLNADGTLDGSFVPQFQGFDLSVFSIIAEDDGSVIVGRFNGAGSELGGLVARWHTNGTPDTNFVAPIINGSVLALAKLPDGKILIGGEFTRVGGLIRNRLARLNADGSHDTNFMAGLSGIVNTVSVGQVREILVLDGGGILIGGRFNQVNGATRFHVARLDENGALDASFIGFNTAVFGVLVRALALQADGKILVGGNFTTIDGQPRGSFARLNANGSLDPSFGDGLSGAGAALVTELFLVGTNKLLLGGGFGQINGVPRRGIARVWTVPPPEMPPQILVQPQGTDVFEGTPLILSIEVVGTPPLHFQWRKNGEPIPGANTKSYSISNTVPADSGSYTVAVTNQFGTDVSAAAVVNIAPTIPVAEAVDAPQLTWTSAGDGAWFGQTAITHDGADAGRSGGITDDEVTDLQITLTGPGTLTFWWKVSSEEDFDFLRFFIDDVEQSAITGEVDWQQRTNTIPAGAHTLRWRYEKDSSVAEGEDAGFLDEVVFTSLAPVLRSPALVGTNFIFSVQTETGKDYTVEFNNDLSTTNWAPLTNFTGNGGIQQFVSPVTNVSQRFFRLLRF